MNRKLSTTHNFRRLLTNLLSIFAILAIALPVTQVAYAASTSPFVGHWQATDIDESDIRLSIGGPPSGPFQITWTESYISFCNGEAGIVRGTAQLNTSDPNLLEAELHVECFTTGASVDFPFAWRYHPLTGTLSSKYENGAVTIWRRPGRPQPTPPALGLRVNYGHDWVESFYEADHMAWITVTESDGVTVKATAELVTEPKDFWDGETGFQTRPEDWIPAPPDIQPNDWVFGWVDNGASGQVQIGEINGAIDLDADSIRGTVFTDWFTEELYIVCDPWGLSDLTQYRESSVYPNGVDEFECSWSGFLDILPGQELGVWYYGPDGHAVVNAFSTPNPSIIAHPDQEWVEGWGFQDGSEVELTIYDSEGTQQYLGTVVAAPPDWDPGNPNAFVRFDVGYDLKAGDHLWMTDGTSTKDLIVTALMPTGIDPEGQVVYGVADPDSEVTLEYEGEMWTVTADLESNWSATLPTLVHGSVALASQWDDDGDMTRIAFHIPNPRLMAFPESNQVFGYDWPVGTEVNLTINNQFIQTVTVGPAPWDPNDIMAFFDFGGSYDLKPGDLVTLSGSGLERTYTVRNLSVTEVDVAADTVSGTADPNSVVSVNRFHFGDQPLQLTVGESGDWLANFANVGIDLVGGMCGRSEIRDDLENTTTVDWCVPNPTFVAYIPGAIEGYDWPMGSTISININDGEYTAQGVPEQRPDFPEGATRVLFELWRDNFVIEAGDHITMTDGVVTKEVVVTNLAVTGIDVSAGTVTGIYDPAYSLRAWLYGQDGQVPATDPNTGTWVATFAELSPGAWGGAAQRDANGNGTSLDFQVPESILWVAAYTYDAGAWSEGQHSYHFEAAWNGGSETTPEVLFNVSNSAPSYNGYVLLRGLALRANIDGACPVIDPLIRPDQLTRFHTGYITDYAMTYAEAQTYFDSLSAKIVWDGAEPVDLLGHEIIPYRADEWPTYYCSYTTP